MKAATIEFGILGPIEVAVDGRALTLAGAKLRTLLAVLLLAEGHSRTGQQLILELWGEQPPPTATAALQVYLSGLRKLLGDRLRRVGSGYLLETKDAEVDAARFVTMTAEARTQLQVRPAEAVNGFTAALALWRGEPLSDTSDTPSVLAARIQLEERRLSAIEDRARAQLGLGRHNEVVNELLGFVAANPTRERLVGQLMIALYRCGRDSDATRTYAALENAPSTHLGVQPSAETSALAVAIRRHDPTISAPSMLPIPATRFVGRRQELDHLEVLLGANRLLTLVGAGGSGKTRLALQLSRDIGAVQHPDGVHFVELAGPWTVAPFSLGSRAPSTCENSPGKPCWTRLSPACATPERFWCWTTASTSRRPSTPWSLCCWLAAAPCGSWPPAGGAWGSRANIWCPWVVSRCRPRGIGMRSPYGPTPYGCSARGPRPRAAGSGSMRPPSAPRLPCADGWTGYRWPSSLRQRGYACCHWARSSSGWTAN